MSRIAQRVLGLRPKARKYALAAWAALRERTVYRGSFLGTALSYGLFVFVFSRIWSTVYSGRAAIEGYGREQMIWYFAIAEVPTMAFSGTFWSLSSDMKSGQVAYLLSRPYSFVGFSVAQGLGRAAANCGILLAEALLLGLATAGPPPLVSPWQAPALLCSLALGCAVYYLCQFGIAMTALWVEENAAFFWIFQKLILIVGTLIPLEFLPQAAQRVAWWTPFPAISYAPARLAALWPGTAIGGRLLGFQLLWAAVAASICQIVYATGRARLVVNGG